MTESNCYGDGTVFEGVRSKDSEIKTIETKPMNKERELLRRALDCWESDKDGFDLFDEIRAHLAAMPSISDMDRSRLLYGFILDCNAIGPENAGVNLAKGIKQLVKKVMA